MPWSFLSSQRVAIKTRAVVSVPTYCGTPRRSEHRFETSFRKGGEARSKSPERKSGGGGSDASRPNVGLM